MKTKAGIIGIILLCVLLTGCKFIGTQPARKTPQQLADEYLAKAQQYEARGELVEAREQYRLLLTVDPENQLAQDKDRQLEQEIRRLAEKHYQNGLAHYRTGRYTPARQEFLTALRYDPEHMQAQKMLTAQSDLENIDRYVLHTIRPGESISTLAQKYYGDYKKFHQIAQYNRIEDATKVRVGQQIKIPVLEGLPIMADPSKIRTDSAKAPRAKTGEIITVKGFITHTVKANESLSQLAQMYYGDFKKFDLIAKFNDMEKSTSLRIGQEIKIPEVEGVPFLASESDKEIKFATDEELKKDIEADQKPEPIPPVEETAPKAELAAPEAESAAAVEDTAAPVGETAASEEQAVDTFEEDQAAAYRALGIELYDKKNFADATIELQKALNANPEDQAARNYLSLAYFELGYLSFNNAEYSQAIKAFERSRQYDSDCERCDTYIKLSEENFKDTHYRKGVALFGREKLAEAIEEWEMVYEMDPAYKDVDKNIQKARNLMERLQEIQQSKEINTQN